jgi:putative sugar O-methyltransferase
MTISTTAVFEDIASMATNQRVGDNALWDGLSEDHRDAITRYGFESFKRTINFTYGQWRVHRLWDSRIRRIALALLRRGQVPWGALADLDLSDDKTNLGERIAQSKNQTAIGLAVKAYATWTGLLWQYATLTDSLHCLDVPDPDVGAPIPVRFNGRPISQDIADVAIDMNRMAQYIPLGQKRRVLEIGGGYGRFAYCFHKLFPDAEYTIVDISPTLAISQNYLAAVFGEANVARYSPTPQSRRTFNFLLPHQIEGLPSDSFDLAINISSFDEMPGDVSSGYIHSIDRLCRGHVYVNGYACTSAWGQRRLGLDELTYPVHWRQLCKVAPEYLPMWTANVFAT